MPSQPELIFVTGPQAGTREVVMTSPAVLGRDPAADVRLQDESASRQHLQFDLLAQGWAVTNLSRNGTVINSRKYKSAKKQILLETGDVLQVGAETSILYVGPGDDPDQALGAWRAAGPAPQAPLAEQQQVKPAEAIDPLEDADAEEESPEAAARKNKIRKYAIGAGIYVAAMIVLILVLSNLGGQEDGGRGAVPPMLTDSQIAKYLDRSYELSTSDVSAGKMLEKALVTYGRRHDTDAPGNLYRTVKYFQLHLAYRSEPAFEDPEHLRMYNTAFDELTRKVTDLYKRAYVATNAQDYGLALALWERLERMLPVTEPPLPEPEHPLFQNVIEHIVYVSRLRAAQR
jgi:pSer/pThr/pTyr-binding forkhead associated (FHA) protein